jgi:serine/threonine-protein kinase
MEEAKYDEADRAFRTAYGRAAALASRHPGNGDMLFERAQAEYWIGAVNRNRGDFSAAREWITRYRDTAAALLTIERSLRAQRELVSGHHNLAVLEFDHGNHAAARPAFLAEKAKVEEMLAASPGDLGLHAKLADIASWLGLIADRSGNFAEAIERLTESSTGTQGLVSREPAVARWRVKLADALSLAASVQARVGQRAAAATAYAGAKAIFDGLVAQDPKNQQWRMRATVVQLSQVESLLAEENHEGAAENLRQARGEIERLAAAEPSAQAFIRHLAKAWRYEATIRLAAHRPDAAEAAQRAIALGETLFRERRGDDWVIWELAQSNILAGRISRESGQPDLAVQQWDRALEVVGERLPQTDDWRFLDSAAQAYALLGRHDEARPLIERLRRFGYCPLNPFAAAILAAAAPAPSPTLTK